MGKVLSSNTFMLIDREGFIKLHFYIEWPMHILCIMFFKFFHLHLILSVWQHQKVLPSASRRVFCPYLIKIMFM